MQPNCIVYCIFENYSDIIHLHGTLTSTVQPAQLQTSLALVLWKLNVNGVKCSDNFLMGTLKIQYHYEIGIADGYYFNFIQETEYNKIIQHIKHAPLDTMDFLVRTIYNDKSKTSNSDFYILRFQFNSPITHILAYHDRGIRWTAVDVLVMNLLERINRNLASHGLPPLVLTSLKGH